jgi:hypothetical protein
MSIALSFAAVEQQLLAQLAARHLPGELIWVYRDSACFVERRLHVRHETAHRSIAADAYQVLWARGLGLRVTVLGWTATHTYASLWAPSFAHDPACAELAGDLRFVIPSESAAPTVVSGRMHWRYLSEKGGKNRHHGLFH